MFEIVCILFPFMVLGATVGFLYEKGKMIILPKKAIAVWFIVCALAVACEGDPPSFREGGEIVLALFFGACSAGWGFCLGKVLRSADSELRHRSWRRRQRSRV